MTPNLTIDQKVLADYISAISERCYYAGWITNIEYILWDCLINGARKYGHDYITQQDINFLKSQSIRIGCWIIFDDKDGEIAIDLDKWKTQFKRKVNNHPNMLNG